MRGAASSSRLDSGAAPHEAAAGDDDDVVDALLHLAQQVRAHEHRAPLVRESLQEAADPLDALGVEAVDRLVEHEHAGVAEQRVREREPLPHAERVAAHAPVGELGDADLFEHRGHPRRRQARPRSRRPSGGSAPCGRGGSSRRAPPPRSRAGFGRSRYGVPPNVAVPAVARTSPSSTRRVVVLPAPFGPRNPVTRPGSTVKLRSSTAVTCPNCLLSPEISMGMPLFMRSPHVGASRAARGRAPARPGRSATATGATLASGGAAGASVVRRIRADGGRRTRRPGGLS